MASQGLRYLGMREVSEVLSDLNKITAYPTTLFTDRQGRVRKIFTRFNGPATGHHHENLKFEFRKIIEELIVE